MTTKEQAIENLKDFHRIMRTGGPEYCLMDGTLLGAFRDGDFCPGDEDDIDIGVMDQVYDRINGMMPAFHETGFQRDKNLLLRGKVEGFSLIRGASHIDVIRVNHHPTRHECYNLGRRHDINKLLAFVYPAKHHAGFDELQFYGMVFGIPRDTPGFLTARYGNWGIKIDRPDFRWWLDCETSSLHPDYDML